ncbi:hypothetical protein CORC01_12552 [Colletotrichum orchidophilum]|uniref:Uncharacterized protein n=1 Tax=Colletotrichum orchidophilum TaxID=1209926 RepID=A0A1G4ASL4_9PEZI|nr:uncharacterized protein CORC01_12552 [Colletotrichum orchidophilum]OHE92149.1 hypothetical protein CORC01_12552 [Colletotrichum orchidophilum]
MPGPVASTRDLFVAQPKSIHRKPVGSAQYEAVGVQDDDERDEGYQGQDGRIRCRQNPTSDERRALMGEPFNFTDIRGHDDDSFLSLENDHVSANSQKKGSPRVSEFCYSNSPTPSQWSEESRPRMWNPVWLRKTVLVIFAVCFLAMLLTTALLYHFSVQNRGLSAQQEVNHYGWKYGPTAVLVVVAALWRQVDHANKILMPWKELRSGLSAIHKTLLLDYVSPLVTNSLWKAIKNRHWAVVSSIVGWALILLTTVFSTGLLILETTEVTKDNVEIVMTTSFDADGFDLTTVGPGPAQVYYAINFQNLPYPSGTSEDMVIPQLNALGNGRPDANFTATTPGAKIGFSCETLPIQNATQTSLPWFSINGGFWVVNVTTPECNITRAIVAAGPDHNIYAQRNATQNYQAWYQDYTCNNDVDWSAPLNPPLTKYTTEQLTNTSLPHRMLFTVADLRFSPMDTRLNGPAFIYMEKMVAVMCQYNYTMSNYEVKSTTLAGAKSEAVLQSANRETNATDSIAGFPNGYLGISVGTAAETTKIGDGGVDYVLSTSVPTFFLMMKMKRGLSTIGSFMDPELLISAASEVFKGVGAQVLSQTSLKPTNTTTQGSITYLENRLHVKGLSTALMCSFLGILTLISIGMIFLRPQNVAPREPGSIAASVTILAASPDLTELFTGLGSARTSLIRERLSGLLFKASLQPGPEITYTIEPSCGQLEPSRGGMPRENQSICWWRPLAGAPWFLALSVCLPLMAVASLEVIQRLSDDRDGFLEVGTKTSTVLATYIPAAVAISLAGMYSSFEAMAAIFAPFAALKKRNAIASRSVFLNLTGKMAPHAIWDSMRSRHFGVTAILVANIMAGFLTIVVSGLYSVLAVQQVEGVALQQMDTFRLDQTNLWAEDNQATAITSLIEYVNLPDPKWTSGDLVLNEMKPLGLRNETIANGQVPLSAKMTGIRGNLNCSVIPAKQREVRPLVFDRDTLQVRLGGMGSPVNINNETVLLAINTTLPWMCGRRTTNVTSKTWMQYFQVPSLGQPVYLGKASIMIWSALNSSLVYGDGAINTSPSAGNGFPTTDFNLGGMGCPTVAVTIGTARAVPKKEKYRNTTRTSYDVESDLATIVCHQNIEEVETNVTFNAPDMTLSKTLPPVVDESTKQLLRAPESDTTSFKFSLNGFFLDLASSARNATIQGPNGTDMQNYSSLIDPFTRALVLGRNGRPIEELAGERNSQNLVEASNGLYKTYIAQAIAANMRNTTTGTGSSRLPTSQGLLVSQNARRLHQNAGPKIALQAMLGVMAMCIVVSRLLIDVNGVLPHDPCSIAGTATMLAGSEMATRRVVPEGAEWRGDGELGRAGVFGGAMRFGIGWWRDGGNMRFGIDVEEEKA